MLRYCTFFSIYTLTRCFANAFCFQVTHLRDATLLHVLFLWGFGWGGGGVGGVGGDVNVHCTCELTWCYATARSFQFTHLRVASLMYFVFKLHIYVMLRYCTFCFSGVSGGGVGGWGGVGGDVNVHCTCELTWCYATARSLQFTHLRVATLLHFVFKWHNDVFFHVHTDALLRYYTISSIYRNYVMLRWLGWGGWVGVITSMLNIRLSCCYALNSFI